MKLKYYLRGLGLGMIVTALILTIAGGEDGSLSDEEIKRRAAGLGMVESSSLTLAEAQNAANAEASASSENDIQQSVEATKESTEATKESVEATKEDAGDGNKETQQNSGDGNTYSGEVTGDNIETDASESGAIESTAPGQESTTPESTAPGQESTTPESTAPGQESTTPESTATGQESTSPGQETDIPNQQGDIIKITVQAGESSYTVSKQLEELGLIEDALSFDKYLCDIGYSRVIHTGTHKIALGTPEEEIAKIITGKR